MKLRINLIIIVLAFITSSFQEPDGYKITGSLTGFPDSTTLYLRNINTNEVLDSTIMIGNNFQFKGSLKSEPEQIWLYTSVNRVFYYANILLTNEHLKLNGDIKDFPRNLKITGSSVQDNYNEFKHLTREIENQRDSTSKGLFKLYPNKIKTRQEKQ